ncbi:MAG: hypothetical protein WBW04_17030 [Nitrolancea sp.]
MLRGCLVGVGIVGAAIGVLMIATGSAIPAAIELLATAVIVVLALLFERRGYRPDVNRAEGTWEETSERFVDPVSGHLIVVRYNPETGERDYVDRGKAE